MSSDIVTKGPLDVDPASDGADKTVSCLKTTKVVFYKWMFAKISK